jgi:predicted site-specific integrase-resolvase
MNDNPYPTMTIAEFCQRYRIDRATYYRNARLGKMPPSIKVGGGTRILTEDEQAWLAKQRGATAQVINQ